MKAVGYLIFIIIVTIVYFSISKLILIDLLGFSDLLFYLISIISFSVLFTAYESRSKGNNINEVLKDSLGVSLLFIVPGVVIAVVGTLLVILQSQFSLSADETWIVFVLALACGFLLYVYIENILKRNSGSDE